MSCHRRARRGRGAHRVGRWAAAALAGLACVVAAGCQIPGAAPRGELAGWPMTAPISMPELKLTDTSGRAYDLRAEAEGSVTLLFFGYTHCPDVCPVHIATLAGALQDMIPEVRNRLRVVVVSTDPERDTPERLREWLDGFDRSFVGLRGSLEEVNEALAAMGLSGVAVLPAEHGGEPMIGHPSAVLAFGGDRIARVRYPFGTRRADWAHDLPLLVAGL